MRVGIIAEIRLYREGLADALGRHPEIEVVWTAGNGRAGRGEAAAPHPDIVLLDMATLDSTSTVRVFRETAPDVKVVALALAETEQHVLACAEAGIAGYVPREGSLEDLVDTLRRVAQGEAVCSPKIVAGLFRRVAALAAAQRPEPRAKPLTARQLEVVELIAQGLSNQEIAQRLRIEPATVKNHVHSILEKLQIGSRAEAAVWARGCGPPWPAEGSKIWISLPSRAAETRSWPARSCIERSIGSALT